MAPSCPVPAAANQPGENGLIETLTRFSSMARSKKAATSSVASSVMSMTHESPSIWNQLAPACMA